MARQNFPRVNFYDGQLIGEADLNAEQTAWHGTTANAVDFLAGSGVEQEFATQRKLFDSSDTGTEVSTWLAAGEFDGRPIYEEDASDSVIFEQPSDPFQGVQLDIEISGANLIGSRKSRVYLFGTTLGGDFIHEALVFSKNEIQTTINYFTTILCIMTQDFRGNTNTAVDGTASRNYGGILRVYETTSLKLVRDEIMAQQAIEPDMNYVNFKPVDPAKTLDVLLADIALKGGFDPNDLRVNTTATDVRDLPSNESGKIIGQKFLATTDNIQKITILLSVQEDTSAVPGEEFDWSGSIIVGIRRLQTSPSCPIDTIPNSLIEFDPYPSAIAQVSFTQAEMAEMGVVLDDQPKEVDFVFTRSLISNPALGAGLTPGNYYMITIERSGNINKGTFLIQEAANTNFLPDEIDSMRMSVFTQNTWTDIPESDMWFKVYTSSVRSTSGMAIDEGLQLVSPKIKEDDLTGISESYQERHLSLVRVGEAEYNYVVVQKSGEFFDPEPHPSTGNLVYSRVKDTPDFSVLAEVSAKALIDAGNKPVFLGAASDRNPRISTEVESTISYPGLAKGNKLTILAPSSDLVVNNYVGSVITPNNNNLSLRYRIIDQEIFADGYGDVNADGTIDNLDLFRASFLDGYSKSLEAGDYPPATQLQAVIDGVVTIEEIVRADVWDTGAVTIADQNAISQHIAGTSNDSLIGQTFVRVVLTLEHLTDPLNVDVNLEIADPSFLAVPFTPITCTISPIAIWDPENIVIVDMRRFVPKTFTTLDSEDIVGEDKSGGENTALIPGDLLLGGEVRALDGTSYKIDFEVATIVIDLPEGETNAEINIFNNFIRGQMKFSDGTFVGAGALTNKQVVVSTAIKSIFKDSLGYDDSVDAADEAISVLYTQASGVLRIRTNGIAWSLIRSELRTKIILTVYLKKSGFTNPERTVGASEFQFLSSSL